MDGTSVEVARFCERRAMLRQGLDVYGRYPGQHVELRTPIQISCVMDAEVFKGYRGRYICDRHPCAVGEDGWGRGGGGAWGPAVEGGRRVKTVLMG